MKKTIICLIFFLAMISLISCNKNSSDPKHEHTPCNECGKCISEDCDGKSEEKCPGHNQKHEHTPCNECGKCISEDCDGKSEEKCPGHNQDPKHEHTPCNECGKCISEDCDGKSEEKCPGHVAIVPNLEVEQKEIKIFTKEETTIEAEVKNVAADIICEVIEGKDLVKLEGMKVISISDKAGTAKVRVSVEGYPEVYIDVLIIVEAYIDTTAPVIELEANALEELKLNWNKEVTNQFLMDGIIASDDIDGDLTNAVKVSHEINNRKYGEYIVKYEVSDKAGNKASLERIVNVVWDYAVQFIGHQGSYYGVGNTEEAFLYAAQTLQYQALETDVKQTKDGVFVCCHDDTFGGLTIANTNWEDLKDVVVTSSRTAGYPSIYEEMPGTGKYSSKICTLERYLEICKEYGIYAVVELKGSPGISNSDQSHMPQLMALIEQEDMLEQTIFLTSAYNCLIWVKQNGYEYIPCQYLVDSFASETVFNRCITYGLDVSGCVTYGNGQKENNAEWVAKYQDAGIKVSTYTFTQYSDYKDVQQWIDIGVDYVTVDWHSMYKLNLPDNSDIVYHTVKFYDYENNLLKETKVKSGRAAAAPNVPEREGYKFSGWSESIKNVTSDMEVTAQYDLVEYTITYDSNLYILTKSTWPTREDFANDFYNDLFDWLVANASHLPNVTVNNGSYKIYVNATENGSCTVSSAQDIKNLNVYTFERTFATMIYKPIEGENSYDYVPEVDNNYFLNSEPYRTKYIGCNEYFLKVMETAYSSYSYTYHQASNNRVQIFFRFHQWCNGSNISAFNNYPHKNIVKYLVGIEAIMPKDYITYTILDEFTLSNPTASIEFLGWYLDHEATSNQIVKIEKGTTGDIILYAKWEEIDVPDVYSKINYVLDGGTNHQNNPSEYLEGVSTILYPAEKLGYIFLGWSKEENSNSYISSISELTSGEITLYANYDYAVYSIDYDLQGGEWGNEVEFIGSAATSIVSTANSDFWNGYASNIYLYNISNFSSGLNATWSFRIGIAVDEAVGTYVVKSIADSGKSFDYSGCDYIIVISSSYTNYNKTSSFREAVAIGQVVKFVGDPDSGAATIEFYNQESISGGKVENYVDEYSINNLPILLPVPKCEGKVFVGWSFSPSSSDTFTSLPEGTMNDITLYAVFTDAN